MSGYSTLEDQLSIGEKLYVLNNGEYKPATCGDIYNHIKECSWCAACFKKQREDYLWTMLFVILIFILVLIFKKITE